MWFMRAGAISDYRRVHRLRYGTADEENCTLAPGYCFHLHRRPAASLSDEGNDHGGYRPRQWWSPLPADDGCTRRRRRNQPAGGAYVPTVARRSLLLEVPTDGVLDMNALKDKIAVVGVSCT